MVEKILDGRRRTEKNAGWPTVDDTCRGWSDDCGEFALIFGIGIAVS